MQRNQFDYSEKFEQFRHQTLYQLLEAEQQESVRRLAFDLHFTFQEFRQAVQACRDLAMWGEGNLARWWQAENGHDNMPRAASKQLFFKKLHARIDELRRQETLYSGPPLQRPKQREKNLIALEASDKDIFGMCPVASEKTVCCNLRTIDAVENCIFGCSYCTIQTFYHDKIIFDESFADKLRAIVLEPGRFYHIGTGQSSDSLAWGNRHGILDALREFAGGHPDVLLELKTKSNNVGYFLENQAPANLVISWSLNTPTIIANEEHFTANLEQRLSAARGVADRGVKVAFHFHPMVYHHGWDRDYPAIAARLMQLFDPEEVLFISMGSVTLIKPVIQKIRELGHPTKMLQMEMVTDPHGKLTYPDDLKIKMFTTMHAALQPWRDRVFQYLCMEKAEIWQKSFGYVYRSNEEFERDFGARTMCKVKARPAIATLGA